MIPIFFTIDETYAPYMDCALRSLVDHASKEQSYEIYILYENLTAESRAKIAEGITEPFHLHFMEMKEQVEGITDRAENRLRCDYFTATIYFRLFLAEMFPQYDKAIYLDSDIIVNGDISEMYAVDLGDHIIGACRDQSVSDVPVLAHYMDVAIGVPAKDYVNSGVLLMNLKKMRDVKFTERFLHLLNTYHFTVVAPDQDYLNAMTYGDVLYLDGTWDAMPPEGNAALLENPKLIHYNLFMKPWCYDNIPYADLFWNYAERSAFADVIRAHKDGYDEEKKQADKESMDRLMTTCAGADDFSVSFRIAMEQGEEVRV